MIFFLYTAAAFIGICGFRFLFPGQAGPAPLTYFRIPWVFLDGVITFIHLFPALAFSALVIPFGLKEHSQGGYAGTTFVGSKGFSVLFLEYLTWPVITASMAAVIYGLLFFLAQPLVMDARASIQGRSELYNQARERAQSKSADGEWAEASQFISICDRIWPESEEIEKIKESVADALFTYRQSLTENRDGSVNTEAGETVSIWPGIPGDPVNAIDAMQLAEEAFNQERYYDAHWLATLAQRLTRPGNVEAASAVSLAARAWEKISALEPNAQEQERYSLFRMKRDAYEAMITGDWVSAYYTFQELSALTPGDPDVVNYLAASTEGIANTAFFVDELDMALGTILNGAIFSLPINTTRAQVFPQDLSGRIALRFSSLATLPDYAYAWGPEAVAADTAGNFLFRVSADYAKLIPISAIDNEGNPVERVVLLFRALDRTNREQQWAPVWVEGTGEEQRSSGVSQIMFDVNYEDFLLLSKLNRGTGGLNLQELYTAEEKFGSYGYVAETFRAEILRRLADPVFFLSMAVLALILGWRYRARKKPRYVYVPMLVILPTVFYGALLFYRGILNNLSIWLAVSLSFSAAMLCFVAGAVICFILALVLLAAQHG
jgi:hypothetical protein